MKEIKTEVELGKGFENDHKKLIAIAI